MKFSGLFTYDVYERDFLVSRGYIPNGLAKVGIHSLFDTYFRNGTPAASWYIGLIDEASFTTLNEDDTMSSHSGWIEIESEYDEAARPAWSPDGAASKTIANSIKAQFTFNATANVKGMFMTSVNTKGGTTGVLWSTGVLSGIQVIQPGQILKAYYSLLGEEG
jgi:hypothetical protein